MLSYNEQSIRYLDLGRELALSPAFLKKRSKERTFLDACDAAGVRMRDIEDIDFKEFIKREGRSVLRMSREDRVRLYENRKSNRTYLLGAVLEYEEKMKRQMLNDKDPIDRRLNSTGRMFPSMNEYERRVVRFDTYNKTWSAGDEAKVRTLHEHLRDRDRKFWIQRGKTRGKRSVLMTKGKRAKTATRTMSDRDRHRTRTVRFETMCQDRASRSAKSAAVYRMRRENAMRLVRRGNNRSVDVEMDIIRRQRRAQTAH
eukprot:g3066.t1